MVDWSNKKAEFNKNCRTPRKLWDSIRFFTAAVARHRTLTIFFLKKSHFHGKSSLNSAQRSGKFGSNPFHHPKNSIGIFLFRVFFDFQKSEKNGEKRRKPEKIPGFSRGIYFDPKTWLRRWDLNHMTFGLWARRATRLLHSAIWCRKPGSNRYETFVSRDFKSRASANFATPAYRSLHFWTEPAVSLDCLIIISHSNRFVKRFLKKT